MKKWIPACLALALCLTLLAPFTSMPAAAASSAALTGPDTVRAGDTITLSFALSGSGIYGASGTLSYDSSLLTLTSTKQKIASPWMVEFNGNNFVAYDNNLEKPIGSKTVLFTATFQVKASLDTGTAIKVSCTNVKTSDGSTDTKLDAVSYSVKLAAPKSTNNKLKSMSVTGAELSPAFNADTVSYSVTVPFSVSKLEVKATAADSSATVSVSSPSLSVGSNTVTVTVTAESGTKKTYTIKVTRQQDPNYVPADNAALSGITIDGYVLSPVFSADVTEYVVWLPYETESITVSGTAADGKAKVEVTGGQALEAGKDNTVKILCTAENGTTTREYILIAKRAAAHGSTDVPAGDSVTGDVPDTDTPGAEDPSLDDPTDDAPGTSGGASAGDGAGNTGFAWYWLAGTGAGALVLGLLLGLLLGRKTKQGKH